MSVKTVNSKVAKNRARVIFSLVVVAMVVGCVGIVVSANTGKSGEAVRASSTGENSCSLVTGRRKCYKSVEIQKGDTLWGLLRNTSLRNMIPYRTTLRKLNRLMVCRATDCMPVAT